MNVDFSVVAGITSAVSAALFFLAKRSGDSGEEGDTGNWVEGCYCCDSGCGETDDDNICLICGH